MSLVIRLAKTGRKGEARYRVVVAERRTRRNGKPIESLGFFEKKAKGQKKGIQMERYNYWISQGAKPSDAVRKVISV